MLSKNKKKRQEAEAAEREHAMNRPADYESANKDAMDKLVQGMVNSSGFGWDSSAQNYQQHRAMSQDAARKAAASAAAGAQALSGGYGSSYADSVAAQGARRAMAGVDDAVPALRAQALRQYQTDQVQQMQALAGMADTERLGLNVHGLNQQIYANQLAHLANESETARQVEQAGKDRAMGWLQALVGAARTAYDGYMGYTQQKWENDFAREQWEYNKDRASRDDALDAYQQAFALYQAGAGDAASQVLGAYGLDPETFAGYTGAPVMRNDQMDALSTALKLAGAGADTAAKQVLTQYGLDAGMLDDYMGQAAQQRQMELALDQATLAGRRRSASGGRSGSTTSGDVSRKMTNSELLKYLEAYNEYQMMGDEESAALVGSVLAESGYNVGGYNNAAGGGQKKSLSSGVSLARAAYQKGWQAEDIIEELSSRGYASSEIAQIMNSVR